MTRDDARIVSRMFACWAAADLDGMLACVDPELEWTAAADKRRYRGHQGVREFFRRQHEDGQKLEVRLQRTTQLRPGCVLAVGRLRVQRPGRGLADSPGVWIFHLRKGKIARIESYRSEREAVQATQAEGTRS